MVEAMVLVVTFILGASATAFAVNEGLYWLALLFIGVTFMVIVQQAGSE